MSAWRRSAATAMRALALGLAVVLGFVWARRLAPQTPTADTTSVAPERPATTLHRLIERSPAAQVGVHVDLYLPSGAAKMPPLMIFVEGGRAPVAPDKAAGASVADAMQRRGIAVAWLTFELGAAYSLTACASDVAAIARELASAADTHAYDRSRITLAGYGIGASLASMVALEHGMDGVVKRVVAVRGTYDFATAALTGNPDEALFAAAAPDVEARVATSPIGRVRADAPPFLLLGASDDAPQWAARAHAFMRALERAGSRDVQFYLAPGRDPRSIVSWAGDRNEVGDLVASFVASGPTPQPIDGPWGAKQRWTSAPPLEHDVFWKDEKLVVTRAIDHHFNEALSLVFQGVMYELHALAGKEYKAIPLGAYLASRARDGDEELSRGDHLVVTNIRGEQLYLTRADIERHAPVLVIGIDDERNLYRLFTWYRLEREYSWKPGDAPSPPTMIRPAGPFLFFPRGAPEHLRNATLAPYGLTPASFRFVEQDPLAPFRGLKKELREALIGREGCLTCHTLRGTGARSHHVRAIDGKPHGGFALALEDYPSEVLHRFLFEQDTVATSFGVGPLHIEEHTANAIEALVRPK